MGRDAEFPLNLELEANLAKLLEALNRFRAIYGKPMRVTSGYRPGHYNKAAGGSQKSTHLSCEACDFADPDGSLDKFCMENQQLLADCGLWLEHPDSTPGWTHLDTRVRNNRVFRP
jgi:uncharacterized protein YcbK (DUF882 family)